jgi:hypothetical protein
MTVHALLRQVYLSGSILTLTADGQLVATNGRALSPELREEIAANKEELIAILTQHRIGLADEGREVSRQFVPAPDCIAEKGCAVLGPCSESLMQRPCLRQIRPVSRTDRHHIEEQAA